MVVRTFIYTTKDGGYGPMNKDKKDKRPKMCKVNGCKNQAGRNRKTGAYYEICDFHYQQSKGKKDAKKPQKSKSNQPRRNQPPAPKPKNWVDEFYDPEYKLISKVADAFFINHPKKIRYIRIEARPIIEKNPDNSITIKSKGRKVVELPFDNPEAQSKAYQEIKDTVVSM